MSGDNFLEEFAMAFKKGDWSVGLRKRIIRFLGLGDDNNFGLTPGIEMEME